MEDLFIYYLFFSINYNQRFTLEKEEKRVYPMDKIEILTQLEKRKSSVTVMGKLVY